MSALLYRLGIEKVSHIPKALKKVAGSATNNEYSKYRSGLYRYWDGENIRNPKLVTTIDELLPGTTRILQHPIWPLLSIPSPEENELVSLARNIEPGLQKYILKHDEATRTVSFKNLSRDRHWFRGGSSFRQMIDRRGLDELAALLIATRAHEFHGAYRVSFCLRGIISEFFAEISQLSEFKFVVIPLYMQVHKLFIESIYKHPHKRDGMLDHIQKDLPGSLDYMLGHIKKLSSIKVSQRSQYSQILKGNRPL
ncbi:hypothetical protein [Pseudomonas sp. 2FG]|uniref:hypothetical protein n=1 Tax=Pseudomonas sp. 2FG TaxID=2502191 RepID=UPI0010F585E7|nr:hypothetical protein [Pseudomonas sp. 2FG]